MRFESFERLLLSWIQHDATWLLPPSSAPSIPPYLSRPRGCQVQELFVKPALPGPVLQPQPLLVIAAAWALGRERLAHVKTCKRTFPKVVCVVNVNVVRLGLSFDQLAVLAGVVCGHSTTTRCHQQKAYSHNWFSQGQRPGCRLDVQGMSEAVKRPVRWFCLQFNARASGMWRLCGGCFS